MVRSVKRKPHHSALRRGAGKRKKKRLPGGNPQNSGARRRTPAVTRKKEAVSGIGSEQDDKRFRLHLGRPRAVAHRWGKGARILTEINRLPQSGWASPITIGGAVSNFFCRAHNPTRQFRLPTASTPVDWTLQNPIGRRICISGPRPDALRRSQVRR